MSEEPGFRAHVRATAARPRALSVPPPGAPRLVVLRTRLAKSAAPPVVHDGAMLAFTLAPDDAAALAVPGGETPQDLHITLVYLGKAAALSDEERAALHRAVGALAATQGAITTTVTGLATFPPNRENDGALVQYASLDPAPLAGFRAALCAALASAHVPYRDDYAQYTPHITLRYGPPALPAPPARTLTFTGVTVCLGEERTTVPFGLKKGGGWLWGVWDLVKARPPKGAVALFPPEPAAPSAPPAGAAGDTEVQHPGSRGGQGHVRLITRGPHEGQMRFMYGDAPQARGAPQEQPAPPAEGEAPTAPTVDDARVATMERLAGTPAGRESLARLGRDAYDEWRHLTPHTDQQRTDFDDIARAGHYAEDSDGAPLLPLLARNRDALLAVDTRRGGILAYEADPPRHDVLADALAAIAAKGLVEDALMLLDWDLRHHETEALQRAYRHPLNRAEQQALQEMLLAERGREAARKAARWQTGRARHRAALRARWAATRDLPAGTPHLALLTDGDTGADHRIRTYDVLAAATKTTGRLLEESVPQAFSALFAASGATFVVTARKADEVQPSVRFDIPPETVGGWYDPSQRRCWVRSIEGQRVAIAAHEMGHGVDHACGELLNEQAPAGGTDTPYRSDGDPVFQALYRTHRRTKALWDYMRKNAHEMFAEGFALWAGCSAHGSRATLARDAPDLAAYFDALHATLRAEIGIAAAGETSARTTTQQEEKG